MIKWKAWIVPSALVLLAGCATAQLAVLEPGERVCLKVPEQYFDLPETPKWSGVKTNADLVRFMDQQDTHIRSLEVRINTIRKLSCR